MPNAILDELWNNWMFRLSLSSNELFHSNFLHLLLTDPASDDLDDHGGASSWERVRAFATWANIDPAWIAACEEEYRGCPIAIYREWKQLDLAVVARCPKDEGWRGIVLFAVELKIKSYPTPAQVRRYLREMKAHNGKAASFVPRLVLLSLVTPPPAIAALDNLRVMDFDQLARGIARLPPGALRLGPATAEYLRLCRSLHELGRYWTTRLTPALALDQVLGMDKTYRRLNPIWSKLCAAYLCELVVQEMDGFPIGADVVLETVPGFSNGRWSADFLWCKESSPLAENGGRGRPKEPVARVGVQVEGDTIRFMMNVQNVRHRDGNPRRLVEEALLAAADKDGLFARLHELHAAAQAGAARLPGAAQAFWRRRPGYVCDAAGLPVLSVAKRAGGFRLTGYTNNASFGHADYRLRLDPGLDLKTLAGMVAMALKGGYNNGGAGAFTPVLLEPDRFSPD